MNDRVAPADGLAPAPFVLASAPGAGRRWWRYRRPSRFVSGVLVGILALQGFRDVVNATEVIDTALGPLLPMDTPGRGDVIVVLGAGVNSRCVPNNYAIQRLLRAAEAYADGRAPLVLITGGRPRGVTCSVAGAMAELGVRFGIPADRIRLENAARNTFQNALYSDPILRRLGARRLVLVTDRLHMKRAEGCFRALGYETERFAVHSPDSHPDNMSMLGFAGHEAVALTYYWLRGRVTMATIVHAAGADDQSSTAAAATGPSGATPALAHPDGPLVVLGASYAAGWHPALPGVAVVNMGKTGQQTFELTARFAADVVSQQPRAVVIWGFANDVFRAPRAGVDAAVARGRREVEAMVARRPGWRHRPHPGHRSDDPRTSVVVGVVRELGRVGDGQDELRRLRQRPRAATQRVAPRLRAPRGPAAARFPDAPVGRHRHPPRGIRPGRWQPHPGRGLRRHRSIRDPDPAGAPCAFGDAVGSLSLARIVGCDERRGGTS